MSTHSKPCVARLRQPEQNQNTPLPIARRAARKVARGASATSSLLNLSPQALRPARAGRTWIFALLVMALAVLSRLLPARLLCAPFVDRAIAASSTSAPGPASMQKAAPTPAQQARQALARRVAATLERLLRARVSSPGKRLQLVIRPGARADEGYLSEVFLSGRPVQVKKLSITELSLRARDVRLDVAALLNKGKIRTLASRSALRAVVTESDLMALLARGRSTRAMNLRVKYLGDRIRVSGNWNWGWLNGPVVGEGRLRLAPGSRVNFDIISLKLNGAELPDFVKSRFSNRINPVLSYEDIPFQPRFRSLQLKGNKAILTA